MPWNEIYRAMATSLATRKAIKDDAVEQADANALAQMGEALGVPPPFVAVLLGGE
jgi:hypothetical protein